MRPRRVLDGARARLQTVQARLGDRLIVAPFSGVLGFREVSVGTLVTPGTRISTLDDISRIKVDFTIPEVAVGEIARGDILTARTVSQVDREFEGAVDTIGSRIDPVTRAAQVRALLDNEEGLLRPGMLMTVSVEVGVHDGLAVPARSVVQEGRNAYVFVVGPESRAERREIRIGVRYQSLVEVLEGIDEGERVVASGVVKLSDGIPVLVESNQAQSRRGN